METVEMDLMQAQIGSLATDVSRLEAKVGKVPDIGHITFNYVISATAPNGPGIYAYHTNAPEVYAKYANNPESITPGAKCDSTSIFVDPLRVMFDWKYITRFDNERSVDLNNYFKVNEDGTYVDGQGSTPPIVIGFFTFDDTQVVIGSDGSVWYDKTI